MICATITGHLAAPPNKVYTAPHGEVYRVRFASNRQGYDSKTKQKVKETVWCSGLILERRIASHMESYTKGAQVVAVSSDAGVRQYTGNDGVAKTEFDLGFIDRIFVIKATGAGERSNAENISAEQVKQQAEAVADTGYNLPL